MRLADKVIFLTGGSAGIGLECARAYAREGARVALCALPGEDSAGVAAALGERHLGFDCDVSDDAQVAAAVARVLERYGRLDAIHNNAGTARPVKPLLETTDAEWNTVFDVNLRSVLHTTRHGFAALRDSRGCILNTASMVGVIGQDDHAAYVATKGGMNALTKAMALDYARYGVRVNAVCPASVWTPMLRDWVAALPDPAGMEAALDGMHPLGACPEGDVIADAAVFLLSAEARFVTGHLMHVSGGAELGYRR